MEFRFAQAKLGSSTPGIVVNDGERCFAVKTPEVCQIFFDASAATALRYYQFHISAASEEKGKESTPNQFKAHGCYAAMLYLKCSLAFVVLFVSI